MEVWFATMFGLLVLFNAHKVIGKFAIVLYVVVFVLAVVITAQWLEIDANILMFSILGGGAAVVVLLAVIGYMKGIR